MEKINSLANGKIKLAASLKTAKKRAETGLFITEGVRLCEEAVKAADSGWKIKFAVFTEEILLTERGKKLVAAAAERGIDIFSVDGNIYKKAAQTVSPQGVLCVIEQRKWTEGNLWVGNPLIVVLDGVADPGNVGTILRTAEAVGATAAIFLNSTADIYNDKTVRASMGAVFRLPSFKMAADVLLRSATENKIKIYITALDKTAKAHYTADFKIPSAVVFGSEGRGVSVKVLNYADSEKIYIPMGEAANSFNVSAASAIVLYEAYRQRR